MLNYLNGVKNTNMNGLISKITTLKNNAIQKLPPVIKQAVDTGGKVASVGVKIATTPMRVAFLGLVRVNTLHLAENVEKAIRKDRSAVLNWWKDFGGDFNELLNITNLGIKAGEKGKASKLTGSLGEPVTIAAATATATPVTASLLALLKKIGADAVKDAVQSSVTQGKTALVDSVKAIVDKGKTNLTDLVNKGNLPKGVTTTLLVTPKGADTTQPTKTTEVAPTTETATEKKSNMPLIIGGIAVLGLGALFLLKKKK
jgi:LPXTG-motif cell wall-anchored protein